jgi:predicted lipoprotein with Yx(FWY)xxD motif
MGTRSAVALLAAAAAAAAGTVSVAGVAMAHQTSATVRIAHSSDGPILVDSSGFTLYLFTADGKGTDHCVKVAGCASAWPPLTVSGKPTAGTGAKASLLGTIAIAGGRKQVTYAGHPLYRYSGDGSPAATGYIGASSFGGTWYGVSATGTSVH